MLTPESNPSKLADDNRLAFITVALGKRKFPLVVRTAVTRNQVFILVGFVQIFAPLHIIMKGQNIGNGMLPYHP
ncbi:hypothetical protein D3C81_1741410 [compost metagenome]